MSSIDKLLQSALYRAFCPDSITLGEYYLGILAEEQASQVRKHLRECPRCQQELNQLKSFARQHSRDIELSPLEHVRQLVARLVDTGSFSALTPAFQGVRGSEAKILSYEADGYQIALDIQDDLEHPGRMAIYGLLLGLDPQQFEVKLIEEGATIAKVKIDPYGNFWLESIPPGNYTLLLTGPVEEIRIEGLQL
jgi:hypothetical protein